MAERASFTPLRPFPFDNAINGLHFMVAANPFPGKTPNCYHAKTATLCCPCRQERNLQKKKKPDKKMVIFTAGRAVNSRKIKAEMREKVKINAGKYLKAREI
jgi:hypothetical protein